MQKTGIEYLTHTWNPIAMRCTPVSAGCKNCWHLRMANRLGGNSALSERRRSAYNIGVPWIVDRELSAPLKRKEPAVIGVQFMGDLFHESVTNEQIAAVFGVMADCPRHVFAVLTKRPKRAFSWFEWAKKQVIFRRDGKRGFYLDPRSNNIFGFKIWPLPNVWFGVSIEDQKTADERIPVLLQIPAEKRFVSVEPLLARVSLDRLTENQEVQGDADTHWLTGYTISDGCYEPWIDDKHRINWVICGAETGPGKRLMNLDWARSVREQCKSASVPFFFKKDSDGNHTLDGVANEEIPR
jgi:protein gp37